VTALLLARIGLARRKPVLLSGHTNMPETNVKGLFAATFFPFDR
jgi:hypothetical protein